jgi:hypothetical protein
MMHLHLDHSPYSIDLSLFDFSSFVIFVILVIIGIIGIIGILKNREKRNILRNTNEVYNIVCNFGSEATLDEI